MISTRTLWGQAPSCKKIEAHPIFGCPSIFTFLHFYIFAFLHFYIFAFLHFYIFLHSHAGRSAERGEYGRRY